MATRKLTPEQEAAKELKNKTAAAYMKEGMNIEEARAAVEANRNK